MTEPLRFTSIQSPNADYICRAITRYAAAELGVPAEFVDDISWQQREQRLDEGRIQVGWICGLPYVWKAAQDKPPVQLLAAPVMQHPRYQKRPIYFSDVVVRADCRYLAFGDLRGACWAYNEPHSHSGYNVTRYHLATLGATAGYFGQVVEAGSHLRALSMVLDGRVDASAIDSTVLELELQSHPELQGQIRIVETLGPSPIPPWVVSSSVSPHLREAIRQVFLQMHRHPRGQRILSDGQMERFVKVEDSDYDAIREMARLAKEVVW